MAEFPDAAPVGHAPEHHETVAEHLTHEQQERLLHTVLSRQAALSLRVSAIFLILLLGLPLANWLAPGAMNSIAPGGFTWTWLLAGILVYPITTLLSAYFVRNSDRIETELAAQGRGILHGEGERAAR